MNNRTTCTTMPYRDRNTSPAPTDMEHNKARGTAAQNDRTTAEKDRVNDAFTLELKAFHCKVDNLHSHLHSTLEKAIQEQFNQLTQLIVESRVDAPAKEVVLGTTVTRDDEEPGEDVPAEEDALDQTVVRDVEEQGEDALAEEVALDQMTVRCVDEPGEDAPIVKAEEAPTAADISGHIKAHLEARNNRDSGEDNQTEEVVSDPVEVRGVKEPEVAISGTWEDSDDALAEEDVLDQTVSGPSGPRRRGLRGGRTTNDFGPVQLR